MARSKSSEAGLTLVELLVAVIITAVIAVVLVRIAIDSTKSLTAQIDEAGATASVVNLYRQMRSDISGATNVYIFDNAVPANSATLCSTWDGTANQWNPATANSTFVRTIISIFGPNIPAVSGGTVPSGGYDITSTVAPTFLTPTNSWVGYELRRSAAPGSSYEIWRVTCADSQYVPQAADSASARRIFSLGKALWSQTLGTSPNTTIDYFSGKNSFLCDGATCDINSSTSSVVRYNFTLKYSNYGDSTNANRASLKLVTDSANNLSKQAMSRKIDR